MVSVLPLRVAVALTWQDISAAQTGQLTGILLPTLLESTVIVLLYFEISVFGLSLAFEKSFAHSKVTVSSLPLPMFSGVRPAADGSILKLMMMSPSRVML